MIHRYISAALAGSRHNQRKEAVGVAPAFVSAPAIIGQPVPGTPVSFTPGTMTGVPSPTALNQWLLDGANITGATSLTYTPVAGDVGHLLAVRQTAQNGVNPAANSVSASVLVALAPAKTADPVIIGTPTVGTAVAASAGSYGGTPAATRQSSQWTVAGVVVASASGATAAAYTPVPADVSKALIYSEVFGNVAGSALGTSAAVSIAAAPPPPSLGIALFFTDIDSGPKTSANKTNGRGCWVTLFGRGFGSTRGTGTVFLGGAEVAGYTSWSDTKIVIELGAANATGNFTVTNDAGQAVTGVYTKPYVNTFDFTVNTKPIFFITKTGTNGTGTEANPFVDAAGRLGGANFVAGGIYYFRGSGSQASPSVYTNRLVVTDWGDAVINVNTAHSSVAGTNTAYVAYPGEFAQLGSPTGIAVFQGGGDSGPESLSQNSIDATGHYFTFANFILRSTDGLISHGAPTSNAPPNNTYILNRGSRGCRVVNNDFSYTSNTNNQSGMCAVGGNGFRILGNLFARPLSTPPFFNQMHAVYIQLGASDGDVAFNTFTQLNLGATVQIHSDHFFPYIGVRIHNNRWINTNTAVYTMRGVTCGDASGTTTIEIYNNLFYGVGEPGAFSSINAFSGQWKVHGNTFINDRGGKLVNMSNVVGVNDTYPEKPTWSQPIVDLRNNIIILTGGTYTSHDFGSTNAQITASRNVWNGGGAVPSFDATGIAGAALLVNTASAATLDATLQDTSPARNAGTTTGVLAAALATDINGAPRPQGVAVDIGAYERA